jgi:cytoskeletal protein CcmA (bactofilin family)
MEVGGAIITVEGVTAHFVKIGRRGKVRGPIKADQGIIGRDAHAENVYGETIIIESYCHISGEVQYTGELRMNEHVSLVKAP